MNKRIVSVATALISLLCAFPQVLADEETLTLTTYYPSPNGNYKEVSAHRMKVGLSYYRSDTSVADSNLLVEGNIGIGTTSPVNKLEVEGNSGNWSESTPGLTTGSIHLDPGVATDHYGSAITWGASDTGSGDNAQAGIYVRSDSSYGTKMYLATTDAYVSGSKTRLMIDYNGNVGIGTTSSPAQKLQVAGNVDVSSLSNYYSFYNRSDLGLFGNGNYSLSLQAPEGISINIDSNGNGTGTPFTIRENGTGPTGGNALVTVLESGYVGIGVSPTYQLQLSTDSAAKPSTNTWTVASDARIKKDIRPYTNGLEIVKKINPVWFKYNGKAGFKEDGKDYIGVIAQEMIKVAPYTISKYKTKLNPDDKGETELLNFNSHALTFDLINAVKELDGKVTGLSKENEELRKANAQLAGEMEKIKARVLSLETAAAGRPSPSGKN